MSRRDNDSFRRLEGSVLPLCSGPSSPRRGPAGEASEVLQNVGNYVYLPVVKASDPIRH